MIVNKLRMFCLFFLLFTVFIPYSNNLNISIAIPSSLQGEHEEIKKDLLSFYPVSLYKDKILFNKIEYKNSLITTTTFDTFKFKINEVVSFIENNNITTDLTIFVVKANFDKGVGGTIGNKKHRVLFITDNARPQTLHHEILHALAGLGDEYSGELAFLPTRKEVDKYNNISLSKYNKEWEVIKKNLNDNKIGYYEGALDREKGLYRSYPDCLMRNLDAKLCPICFYYTIKSLNELTNNQIDYILHYQIYLMTTK